MSTEDFSTELFCRVADQMLDVKKHSQANLHPSEGVSNKRWIVGGKLYFLLNYLGLIVDWDIDTANVYDGSAFQYIVEAVADNMLVFADTHFAKVGWEPTNLKVCPRGTWNDRMISVTRWLSSISWFNGTAYNPTLMDLCLFPLLSSLFELAPKVQQTLEQSKKIAGS